MPADALIRLWRTPHRFWDLLSMNPHFGVIIDGAEVDDIWPKQVKVYTVSPGDHWLHLAFYWFLRRSEELHVSLVEGEEKQIVCYTNLLGFAALRVATPKDVAGMERWKPPPVTPRNLGGGASP